MVGKAKVRWVLVLGMVLIANPLLAFQEKGSKPNVVLILADDLGWGDLGCFGAKEIRTPRLDQLAAQGVRFEQFYVSQAVCTASRAALMTGCYANRVGMSGALNHTSPNGIHPQEVLLSNLFKDQGYATAIFGKWHLGHHPPFLPTRRGFDEWAGLPYSNDNGPLHPVSPDFPALPWYENEQVTELDPDQSLFTRRITDRCVEFIRQHRQQPFFLYVPHIMPHVPIFASESFRGKSKAGLYGDVVEELDASIGQIVDVIDELGLSENTLILFASDNGPFLSYGQHAGSAGKLREGKLTCYEGGMRVPAIARWKGRIANGKTSQAMISTIDLYATLGKLIGAQLPEKKRDSLELLPVLLGDEVERGRPHYWYYAGEELQAVRDRRWKLHLPHRYLTVAGPPGVGGKPSMHGQGNPQSIEQSGIYGIASRHGYRVESTELALYDLNQDPSESENVAHLHPDIVKRLTKMAEEARKDLGDSITQIAPTHARAAGDVRPRLPEGVRVVSNRTYATRKTGALLLDLYLPQKPSSSSLPTVVWIHGGGWSSGAKENCPWTWLPSEGFAVASIDYRLSHVAKWPSQLEDGRDAVRWLQEHAAEYGLNPQAIAIGGGSAGGHLAALVGMEPRKESDRRDPTIRAVIDLYGPTDLLTMPANVPGPTNPLEKLAITNGSKLLGGVVSQHPDMARDASPLYHVRPGLPPFLILHGSEDTQVPSEQSMRLHQKLKGEGVESTIKIIAGAGHGGKEFDQSETRQSILTFLRKHLNPGP